MGWIFLMMLAMVVGSIIIELILPMRVKNILGWMICWSMRTVTMLFLTGVTVGLIYVSFVNLILPLFTGSS